METKKKKINEDIKKKGDPNLNLMVFHCGIPFTRSKTRFGTLASPTISNLCVFSIKSFFSKCDQVHR